MKKSESKRGGTWHNASLNTLLTAFHLFRDMIMIGKDLTIAFSAIGKLVALVLNLEKAERKSNSTLALSESKAEMAYEIWHPYESSIVK